MLKKDYSDVKMVRESEFDVVFEIGVEYQAEKVAKMAEKTTFLKNQAKFESFFEKKSITRYSTRKNKGSLLFEFFKILKSIFGHFTYFFGQSLKKLTKNRHKNFEKLKKETPFIFSRRITCDTFFSKKLSNLT